MRQLLFAALAAISLSMAVVPAYATSTIAGDRNATIMQETGGFSGGGN